MVEIALLLLKEFGASAIIVILLGYMIKELSEMKSSLTLNTKATKILLRSKLAREALNKQKEHKKFEVYEKQKWLDDYEVYEKLVGKNDYIESLKKWVEEN